MPGGAASRGRGLTARSGNAREVQALPQRGRASSDPKLSYTRRSPTPEGAAPRRSEHRPLAVGMVPLESTAQDTDLGAPLPRAPGAQEQQVCTLSRPRSADTRLTRGAPPPTHTHRCRPPPGPLARAGELRTSLTVSAFRKLSSRRARAASPATHSAARGRASTRSRAGWPAPGDEWGAPPPRGGSRGGAGSPSQPQNQQTKGHRGTDRALPQTYRPPPPPQDEAPPPRLRPPPTRRHFGERPHRGIVQPAGSTPHPSPSPGDSWGPAPPEPRRRAERAGAPSRQPAPHPHPRRRSLRPLPRARPAEPRALTSPPAAQLVAAPPRSEPPCRRPSPSPGRAAAEEGPAPWSSRAPPPGRPRPAAASPREARALESFGCRMAAEGAAAAAGRGRWRLLAPESGEWGGLGRERRRRRRERAGRREGPARAVTSGVWAGESGRQRADPGRQKFQGAAAARAGPSPTAGAGGGRARPNPSPPPRPGEGNPSPFGPAPAPWGGRVPNLPLPHSRGRGLQARPSPTAKGG